MAKDYKKKKGATGKQYTTVGDVIKVTYTDGSTRVVRPSDKTYAATKKAMETDISQRNPFGIGNKKSKTTAETAVGKGVTDGVVTSAKKVQQNQQYSNTMKQRRAQEAQQKAVAEVAKRDGYNTKPVQKVDNTKKNNNLADALAYGAKTGANTAVSGIKSGVIGAARTAADVVGADNLENNLAHQLRLASAKQQLEQQRIASQYNTNFGGAARVASDVTAGAVGMLPTIGSFVLTPQGKIAAAGKAAQLGAKAIGFAPLALQSYGGGQNQALNEGATINQANAYGAGTMAKELGTEILFGGIPYVPGIGNIGKAAANMVKGETAKKVASAAGKMAGEGIEEMAATIADPFIQQATYNPDAEMASGKDIAYSGLVGGLTAGALNAGVKGINSLPNHQKVVQNDANRAFEALHGQKMGQNEVQNAQKPQIKPQQAQDVSASKHIPAPEKAAQNQNMKAGFQQEQPKIEQKTEPMKFAPEMEKSQPKISLEMSERTFENVKDKNVKAYQQEHPEVKPYQQATAEELLSDLQMGERGRREYGFDTETRNVTTMQGIKRNQSEPIERMLNDGMKYDQIEDGLQRIIEDNGKENTPNAKRAELYVHDAMQNGYNSIVNGRMDANRNYAISKMSMEELEAEAQRLTENLSTTTDEYQLEMISNQLEAVENRMNLLKHDVRPTLDRPEATVAENATAEPTIEEPDRMADYEDADQSQISGDVLDFWEKATSKSGLNIRIVNGLSDNVNGMYRDGIIYLNANRVTDADTIRTVTAHEVYHSMKGTDEFGNLQDVALDFYRTINPNLSNADLARMKIEEYAEEGVQLNEDEAYEELTADFIEVALSEPKVAERIWTENPTLAQRIKWFIEDLLASFKDRKLSDLEFEQKAILEQAQQMYSDGLQSMKYQKELSVERNASGRITNGSGEVVAEQENGEVRFNIATYEIDGRNKLHKFLNKMTARDMMAEKEADDIKDTMDYLYGEVKDLTQGDNAKEYKMFTQWSEAKPMLREDGTPVLSVVTKNGEYNMNLDSSTRCAKRVPMDNLLKYLANSETFDISTLKPTDFAKINEILDANGFSTPCKVCFIEARRDKSAGWASEIANEYNTLLEAANIQNGTVDTQALQAKAQELKKQNGKDDAGSVLDRYVKFIMEKSDKARPIKAGELMHSEGMVKIKSDMPEIYSIASSRWGAATPKPLMPEAVYNSDLITNTQTEDQKLNPMTWSPEAAFDVGGVRLQSFSDYRDHMFFDKCQEFSELAAKKLPAHGYAKVENFIRLFGMTNAKLNMSGLPATKVTAEERAHINSLSDAKKKKDPIVQRLRATAGLDENGNYLWDKEGFDYDTAMNIQRDERYSNNVGFTVVGVSDAHIWKMFDDKDIRMIVPYHRSSINPEVAKMKNIDICADYTDFQNNTKAKGSAVKGEDENWQDYYRRLGNHGGNLTKVDSKKFSFDFYGDLMETFDAVETTKNYIDACQKADVVPKFPQFIYKSDGSFNENYYKVLTDFTLYNEKGKFCPQKAVKFGKNNLPEEWRNIVTSGLKKQQETQGKIDSEIANVGEQVIKAVTGDGMYSVGQIGGSGGGRSRYQDMLDRYGNIEPGENPNGTNRDVKVPKQTSDWDKTRKFTRTAMEAEQVDDITVGMIASDLTDDMQSGRFIYEPTSNKAQVDRANRLINQTGWEQQSEQFRNKYRSGESMSADDIALGERLIQEAQKAGDYQMAVQLIADVAAIGTEVGRSVQALKILKRLTPEGQLMALKRLEQRINGSLTAQGKEPVALPESIAEEMLQARGSEKQSEIWDKAIMELSNQVPATFADKVNAWRYLAMLSNPKTHIRNMVGNSVMLSVSSVKRGVQMALEKVLLTAGEERYADLNIRVPKEYKEFAEWSWENEGRERAKVGGGRYNDAIGQIEQNKPIFKNGLLEKARKTNADLLENEDMMFKKKTYIDSLARYMHTNGLSPNALQRKASNASYSKGVDYALREAYKGTFQEASAMANLLSRAENSSKTAKLLIGGAVPFKKTPINILKRGVEYSPVGLVNGIYKMLHDVEAGTCTKAEAIDSIAAGFTGSIIMALGYFMASMGWISAGSDEDDERKQWYDQSMGSQNYALVLPNGGTATIDWMAPSVMPLMAGAELYSQLTAENPANEQSSAVTSALEAISKVANPVLEMSMLQGVTDALQSYNSGTTGVLSDLIASTATSYGGQFIPAPVGALARTVDDTVRSSYAPKDSPYTKTGEKFMRQQRSKITDLPVLSEMGLSSVSNEPSIDVWGNERKREGDSLAMRAFHNFINPSTYSSNKRTELDDKLNELYENTGESSVLPKSASTYINQTNSTPKINLTAAEYSRFAQTQGQKSYQYIRKFVNSRAYSQLADEDKVKIISDLYSLANYQAKKEAMNMRGYNYTNETYAKVLRSGADAVTYYTTRKLLDNKYSYEEAATILASLDELNMTPKQYLNIMIATKDIDSYDANGKSKKGLKKQRILEKSRELGLNAQQADFIYQMSKENWRMYNIWN